MSESQALSLEEITTAMTEAIETDGTIKKRFNAVVQFHVDGNTYTLNAKNHASPSPSHHNDPVDLEVTLSLSTLQDLLQKKMTPQQAFIKRQLKIKGGMGLAMKLNLVLDATRKTLALRNARL